MTRASRAALAGYWAAYLSAQLWVALRLRVDYNDAFDYLRNARRLTGEGVGFGVYHAPMTALLHAPLQLLLSSDLSRVVAPHLYQLLLSAALLAVFYRYLRLSFAAPVAHLGAVLFSLDRMVVHYFCPVMSELPCALFLVSTLLLLEKKKWAPAALALAACLLSRWSMMYLPAALLGWDLTARGEDVPRRLAVYAAGAALAAAACVAVYSLALGGGVATTLRGLAYTMRVLASVLSPAEPLWKDPLSLWLSAGPAACALAGLGLARLRDDERTRFNATLLALALALPALAVGHREPRFLIQALPFFYYLAAAGIERALTLKKLRLELALAALAAVSGFGAAREISRYADPVYADDSILALARSSRKPGARVYWDGKDFTRGPAGGYVFAPGDGGFYVYDVPSAPSLAYLLGDHVYPLDVEGVPPPRPGDVIVRGPPKLTPPRVIGTVRP